jgi:hypothetical protein
MPLFGPMLQSASSDIRSSDGSIKTKMLEAFAHGTAVIGNAATFEAVPLLNCRFQVGYEADLPAIRRDPGAHRAVLEEAACFGVRCLAEWHAPAVFAAAWKQMLKVKTPSRPQDGVELHSQSTSVAADIRK